MYFFNNPFCDITKFAYYSTNLFFIQNMTKIFLIQNNFNNKISYVRSFGVYGLIKNINFTYMTILVRLPSGYYKVFSFFTKALFYNNFYPIKVDLTVSKFSYKSQQGKKSLVRGVAKNPVDHPHGGRTNTIKSPKTP